MAKAVSFLILSIVLVLAQGQRYFGGIQEYYGPYSQYRVFYPTGFDGYNPAVEHIANSFYYRIVRRLNYVPISQTQADNILKEVTNNFNQCEREYFQFPDIPQFKRCIQMHTQLAMEHINRLAIANRPIGYRGGYRYAPSFGNDFASNPDGNSLKASATDSSETTEKSIF